MKLEKKNPKVKIAYQSLIFYSLLLIMLCMSFSLVEATVTITTPASGGTINGTYNFRAVISGAGDNIIGLNVTNFTVTLQSTFICSVGNYTYGQTDFNCSSSTTGVTDTTSATVNVTFWNGTTAEFTSLESKEQSNALDNTAPVCNLVTPINGYGGFTADGSGSGDAIDSLLTYSISLEKPHSDFDDGVNTSGTNAASGDIRVDYLASDVREHGEYTVRLTVTDNAKHTSICSETVDAGGVQIVTKSTAIVGGKIPLALIIGLVLIIIIIIIIIIITVMLISQKQK